MIVEEQVFDDSFLPDRLLHREAEVETLAEAFEPALDGDRPEDIVITGPHGVGKTVLARHTYDRLERRANVEWAHIRAMGLSTAGIIREILETLGGDPSQTTPKDELVRRLQERVENPVVVILDEGDELNEDSVATLAEIPQVTVIPIVHEPDTLLSRIEDDRLRHRLNGRLELDRYRNEELADILEPRVDHGLRDDVDREYLHEIADHVGGVARQGIQTLRGAAEIAANRDCPIEDVDVEDAHERAMRWIRRSNLESLPLHHQVLYELIRKSGPVSPEELHESYEAVADAVYQNRDRVPVGQRARRNKLRKLEEYGLIDIVGENRHREYRVIDEGVTSAQEFAV